MKQENFQEVNKKKNIYKLFSILGFCLLIVLSISCKETHIHKFENGLCECGELHDCEFIDGLCECGATNIVIDVAYFNKHLDISNFTESNYKKIIKLNDITLLEEVTISTKNGEKYDVATTIKKLNNQGVFDTTTASETKELETKVTLDLKEEYFNNVKIIDKTLEVNVKNQSVLDLLGVLGTDTLLKISLNEDLKICKITLEYQDLESNFKVYIEINYQY